MYTLLSCFLALIQAMKRKVEEPLYDLLQRYLRSSVNSYIWIHVLVGSSEISFRHWIEFSLAKLEISF